MVNNNNKVELHIFYGINLRLRFYPNIMVTIIPRLFFNPLNMNKYEYIKLLYSNNFRNGISTNLKGELFNKFYKIITNFIFISNNYNRQILLLTNGGINDY